MGAMQLAAFAFLAGVTVCGLAGSAMELVAGRRLTFAEPYMARAHFLRSLAVTLFAGPFMLVNDALAAHRGRCVSTLALLSCMCTALVWTFAMGIVAVGVASWAAGLLSSIANSPA